MDKVISSVREHVEEEEGDVLPKLRESTSAETREKLGSVVESAKKVVPTHPHPLVIRAARTTPHREGPLK